MSLRSVCLCACLLGCGAQHVALTAPPASAPAAERLAAFERLRPLSTAEARTGIRGAAPESVLRTSEELQLAGGPRVAQAEDLLPVLPPDSEAAQAARRSSARETRAGLLTAGGVLLMLAGAAVAVTPFVVARDEDERIDTTPIYLGTGLVVLSVPMFLWSGAERRSASDERAVTFEHYEPELRRRLDLCERPQGLEPCR